MDPEEPPAGFNIQIVRQMESVTYSWPALERHPIQWIPLGFGALMMIQALAMPILFFTNLPNDLDTIPLVIACAVLVTVGTTLFWSGYRKRGCEIVELRPDSITYDNGPTVMPFPVLLLFGAHLLFLLSLNAGEAAPIPHFRRRKRSFSRESIRKVTLDRIGVRQRLWFDSGRDRVEVGNLLTEPEREWLFQVMSNWQQANKPVSQDPPGT